MLSVSRKLSICQNIKHFANVQRSVCSGRFPQLLTQDTLQNAKSNDPSKGGYGDKEICLLGPVDIRTPLPGNTGFPHPSLFRTNTISQLPEPAGVTCEVTTRQLPEERYQTILLQATCVATENALSSYSLECVGHDCPQLVRKDLLDLFPTRDLTGNLTAITLCQHTQNDMSEWSESAEAERIDLESRFLTAASAICAQLKYLGYWADFIHPSSGKPNFDSLTNATMFETDLRYRHLGFNIEDLGCCRIIRHNIWGTHMFVGAVFTNASIHSKEVQNILYEKLMKEEMIKRNVLCSG